nr:MAG TPA: hypothetical protein [Caudoviricetes sp.]
MHRSANLFTTPMRLDNRRRILAHNWSLLSA